MAPQFTLFLEHLKEIGQLARAYDKGLVTEDETLERGSQLLIMAYGQQLQAQAQGQAVPDQGASQ